MTELAISRGLLALLHDHMGRIGPDDISSRLRAFLCLS
jgi:hypothetical protein